MTVELTEPEKITALGNGVAFDFSFSPMVIYVSSDLVVTHVATDGTETVRVEGTGALNYSVTVSKYPGTGYVTYPADKVVAMPAGEKVVMKPVLPMEQQTNLENQGGYHPDVQEVQFDKLLKISKQQQEELGRTIKLKISSSFSGLTVPDPSASTVLGWDAGGTYLLNYTPNTSTYIAVPVASTDNAIARFNGVGGATFQNSGVTIDDSDNLAVPGTLAVTGATTLGSTLALGGVQDTNGFAINESEGAVVVSAATTNVWVTDGNTIHVSGTTTITSFGTAPQAGAWRKVVFDAVLILTNGANLNLQGGANITTAQNDFAFIFADTATRFRVLFFRGDGTAVVVQTPGKLVSSSYAESNVVGSTPTLMVADNSAPQNTEGEELLTVTHNVQAIGNSLYIRALCNISPDTAGFVVAALFQDTTVDAMRSCLPSNGVMAVGDLATLEFTHRLVATATGNTIFKLRAGSATGSLFWNQRSSALLFNGTMITSLTVEEVAP